MENIAHKTENYIKDNILTIDIINNKDYNLVINKVLKKLSFHIDNQIVRPMLTLEIWNAEPNEFQ